MARTMVVTLLSCLLATLAACAAPSELRPTATSATTLDRYLLPQAISPEAAAMLGPLLERQRATVAERLAIGGDFAVLRARAEQDVEARMAAVVQNTGITVATETMGGVPVLRITPPNSATDGRILVYVHGGGWVQGSVRSSLRGAALYAVAIGLPVISVEYGLAPQHDYRDVTGQLVAVYRALLAAGHPANKIGMFGDSAGGNIVAGGTLRLRDEGLPMPAALVLLSPCVDLGTGGDTRTTLSPSDPALDAPEALDAMMRAYAGSTEGLTHPWASPVYGDYSRGYPPTLIQGGTRELLLSDFVREYQAIRASGGEAVLDIYEGMPHVFMSYLPTTPEGQRAIATARDFLFTRLAR